MSITTKTGDQGQTSIDKIRVGKDHLLVEAVGSIDELQSVLGVVKSSIDQDDLKKYLSEIQKDLYLISGEIAGWGKGMDYGKRVGWLEDEIDRREKELPELKNFVIPGENKQEALLNWSRSVVRRAERRMVALKKEKDIGFWPVTYLNRLSDYLFIVARQQAFQAS